MKKFTKFALLCAFTLIPQVALAQGFVFPVTCHDSVVPGSAQPETIMEEDLMSCRVDNECWSGGLLSYCLRSCYHNAAEYSYEDFYGHHPRRIRNNASITPMEREYASSVFRGAYDNLLYYKDECMSECCPQYVPGYGGVGQSDYYEEPSSDVDSNPEEIFEDQSASESSYSNSSVGF